MNIFEFRRGTAELDARPNVCRRKNGVRVVTEATRERLLSDAEVGTGSRQCLQNAKLSRLDDATVASARARLITGFSSYVADDVPPQVRDEALLRLIADESLYLEYIGRGEPSRIPGDDEEVIPIDVTGGVRRYLFRCTGAEDPHLHGSAEFTSLLARAQAWLDDPDARLVLSIGGGGYRMFATTPILTMFDVILDHRSRFEEVWGCSGGAVAGHVFAEGLAPDVLDQFAYRLYHDRDERLPDYSVASVAKLWFDHFFRESHDPARLKQSWIEALEELQPEDDGERKRIPFYAVASNTAESRLNALCLPGDVSPLCRDFMVEASRARALAASAAVPMLFPAQHSDEQGHVWVDGGLIDENPLALPFVKWQREREAAPQKTPEKLKIFLIDLNARAAESEILTRLTDLPLVGSVVLRRIVEQVDLLLDSRQHLTLRMLADIPQVEVLRAQLSLGVFAVRDRGNILRALQSGRQLPAWSVSIVGDTEDNDE